MAKWFSGCGFAWAANAGPYSLCALAVIADSAIAAAPAVIKRGFISGAKPTAAISKVRKGASIIGTGKGNTVGVGRR
jgi:hypothetical protein